MTFNIPRTMCVFMLVGLITSSRLVAAGRASISGKPAGSTHEQARAGRIARARNRGPGSVAFYEYVGISMDVGPLKPNGFSLDAAEGFLWRGHSAVGLRLCEQADDYYCFHGPALSFAVPKAPLSDKQSWIRFDRKYVVIAQGSIRLLGRSTDVHVIESVDELGRKRWFYFSDQYGLVAVALRSPERMTTETFYSRELYGYPRTAPVAPDASSMD
jgi:hypothetical protein